MDKMDFNDDTIIKQINQPTKKYKSKYYEKNKEYCKLRYRRLKYEIRDKYFQKKMKKIEDKANAFREKLKNEELLLNTKLN
jgi:hypothetical protein